MKDFLKILSIQSLFIISSCSFGQDDEGIYLSGFEYSEFTLFCDTAEINSSDLFSNVLPTLRSYLLNYEKTSLIGYKILNDNSYLVQIFFTEYVVPNVTLPGEGGVVIVIEPCGNDILYSGFFHF